MGWRKSILADWDNQGIGDATTKKTIKLPPSLIGAVTLNLHGTGGASGVALDTDPTIITRVKLTHDRADILYATGTQLRARARKVCGTIPTITNADGAYSQLVVPLYAGRKPRDRRLLFDFRNSVKRSLEISFSTLIGATVFATTTVALTVTIDEWVGAPPSGYKGFFGFREVEDKATGTYLAVFDLLQNQKLAFVQIEVVTITTIGQVQIKGKKGSTVFLDMQWRDILNMDNYENDKETAETTLAEVDFYDEDDELVDLPDLAKLGEGDDPILTIDRGATTSVTCIVQGELY